jgi:hypothetical protein
MEVLLALSRASLDRLDATEERREVCMLIRTEITMRQLKALIATFVAVVACKSGGDDATGSATAVSSGAAAASGATQVPTAAGEARMGGQVVAVGAHSVELKLYDRGLVEAWVFDASGKLVADAQTKLSLRSPTGAAKVECAFDATSSRLVGRARREARFTGGPIEVELSLAGGASAKATLEAPVLLSGPRMSGALVVAGKYSVEIAMDADGKIQALLRDAAGDLVDGKQKLELKVGEVTVALAWDGAAKFVGRAEAGVGFAAGPVSILIDGSVAAKLPRLAIRAEAKHEGRLVAVGGYTLELVAEAGALIAYVFDAKGAAHAAGDLDISIQIGGADGVLKLAWDAPSLAYKVAFAGDIEAEITAVVKAGGEVSVGISPPTVKARADVDLDAEADIDAKADAKVDAKLPAPKAKAGAGASTGNGKAKAKAEVKVGF